MSKSKVTAARLPGLSLLHDRIKAGDFVDCYSVASSLTPRRAAEVIAEFPGWARCLMRIRKVATTPFGLSNEGPAASDKIGIFPVEAETSDELVAGFNDKHLDFRISIVSQNGRVFLATWVHPHNVGGRLYLRTILPFHVLIARNALARVGAERSPALPA